MLKDYVLKDEIMQIIMDYSTPKGKGVRRITYENAIKVIEKIVNLCSR